MSRIPSYLWEALQAAETHAGVESLLDFVPMVSPHLSRPNHLRPLAEIFVRAEQGPIRACSSVPPQHGKTLSIAHWLVRYLMRFPHLTCCYVSYDAVMAQRKSRIMQDIADRAGLVIRRDVRRLDEWRTPAGGGMLVTGIGGPLTGEKIDGILVVDDPVKNRIDAESATIRDNTTDWITSTAISRLHPRTSVLFNMTRWTVSDPIGYLTESGDWSYVNLPAVNERGEALWPEQRPLDFLMRQKRIMGEYDWASLYMGQPTPKGQSVFGEPAVYDRPDLNGSSILIACDPAITERTTADYSAIVVGAGKIVDGLLHVDILHVTRFQVELKRLCQELRGLSLKWGAKVAVEAVGGFKAVVQALRDIDRSLSVVEINSETVGDLARGDKRVRALPLAAAWNDARVRVPSHPVGNHITTDWVHAYTKEFKHFNGVKDAHDDQVDATAHLINALDRALRRPAVGDIARRISNALPFG